MTKKRRGTKEGRHCHECAFLVLALPSLRVSVPPCYIILIRLELRARAETTLHFAAGILFRGKAEASGHTLWYVPSAATQPRSKRAAALRGGAANGHLRRCFRAGPKSGLTWIAREQPYSRTWWNFGIHQGRPWLRKIGVSASRPELSRTVVRAAPF